MEPLEPNIKLLKEDSAVTKILSDPSKLLESPHFDSIKLNGLLGSSTQEGYWRLYTDSRLDEFVEIKQDDIIRTEKESGRTSIYIKNGVKFFHVKIVTDKNYKINEDESTSGGHRNLIFSGPGRGPEPFGGPGDHGPSDQAEMAEIREKAQKEERERVAREERQEAVRREREFLEKVDKIDEMIPGALDALITIGVEAGREVLGKLGMVLEGLLVSDTIGPEDLDSITEACKMRLEDIQKECQRVRVE